MLQIQFIPCVTGDIGILPHKKKDSGTALIFRCRKDEQPTLFMHQVSISLADKTNSYSNKDIHNGLTLCGTFVGEESFSSLQDGDSLLYTIPKNHYNEYRPFYMEMNPTANMLLPFEGGDSVLELAAGMEEHPNVYICTPESEVLISRASQIADRTKKLYEAHPAYQHIMLKTEDGIVTNSLVSLAAKQDRKKHDAFIALFLALSSINGASNVSIANRILENCEFDESFSLLTQEEQVSAFIEFSRKASTKKKEYVSDQLITQIEHSKEYHRVKDDLSRNGLGISKTQQFNVFQQVGYFSQKIGENILYNLSDMGAGKTLMTVEAIFLLDLKQMSTWKKQKKEIPADLEIESVFLPDKHIIAPTLSVKSSWVDTFRLFYDVTEVDENTYTLSLTYDGITATSTIYVAPFTVKNGNIFVHNKLPETMVNTYLIIDEIHQLVVKNIAKTKFFPPKTNPSQLYRIFILSGTMSNLKTQQWFHFMRFMGLDITSNSASQAASNADSILEGYSDNITHAATNIRSEQHRYFDSEDFCSDNYYKHVNPKKQTSIEQEFYAKYGSQILSSPWIAKEAYPVERLLNNSHNFSLQSDPNELDSINFELFYKVVGSKAITAQSLQVAEELFGEQKKQHVSDIIKTVSPLSQSDIQILKTLHHIAEDHNQYKSVSIAKAINNAILNLNDGLQTKNIYEIVSGYADKNLRFFEYLESLDVNILEQLPKSGLISTPKLEDTDKFKVLQDILRREKEETHLIVVNDYFALKSLSEALGIEHLTKDQLKRELDYQEVLDELFEKQSIVIVTQDMIKSSLDLIQANRLIQYQLNTEISDIIQTQNRINRIGQTRETRGYYIASDQLQENLITLFLESYRNIRVAHKGIVELFTDITSQINVVNDYLERAFSAIEQNAEPELETEEPESSNTSEQPVSDLIAENPIPAGASIAAEGDISRAILYPQQEQVLVLLPLTNGNAFPIGMLTEEKKNLLRITMPTQVQWNLKTNTLEE